MSSLDYVYILDATGSQQRYINLVRDKVIEAADEIRNLADILDNRPDSLRLRLISFRDHGSDFVSKAEGFTSDVTEFKNQVKEIMAFGGRDGPEAQADALAAAVNDVAWGPNASKVVTLITDSPPHGIKGPSDTYEDEYPNGCPDGNDLTTIKQKFLDDGVILNVWACEPTLSKTYKNAEAFYKSWTQDTGGDYSQLDKTGLHLKLAMVGTGLKALDTNRLAKELGPKIVSQAHLPAKTIAANLHRELSAQGVQHYQLHSTDASVKSAEVDKNIATWSTAASVSEARSKIVAVPGDRLLPQYSNANDIKISYSKEPITQENVENIVALALRRAKVDTPAKGTTPKNPEAPKQDAKKIQGDKEVNSSAASQAMRLMGRK